MYTSMKPYTALVRTNKSLVESHSVIPPYVALAYPYARRRHILDLAPTHSQALPSPLTYTLFKHETNNLLTCFFPNV